MFELTPGQQRSKEIFCGFITNPSARVLVISGYAGTGKSTLVNNLLEELPATLKLAKLINQENISWEVKLTATTNKAKEALAEITHQEVKTIQSLLGLRVFKNYATRDTELKPHGGAEVQKHKIIFIDECSYIDDPLLSWIFKLTKHCKIIFIGDRAQLTTPKSNKAPVFMQGFKEAKLTEVVRQEKGNPIIELATCFRDTVSSGEFFSFSPDKDRITHVDRLVYDQQIIDEFSRKNWQHNDSKVLAWTNKTVIRYNSGIREEVKGDPELGVGDYVINNQFIENDNCNIKTDQGVIITDIYLGMEHGVVGWKVELDNKHTAFLPKDRALAQKAKLEAHRDLDVPLAKYMDNHWIDLRAAYACTINKSQGSTYRKVFIDLDDVAKCHNGNQIARMMYVAVSRASEYIIFTGDLL